MEHEDLPDEVPAQNSGLVAAALWSYQKTCPPKKPKVNTQAMTYSRPTAHGGNKNKPTKTTSANPQNIQGSLRMMSVHVSPPGAPPDEPVIETCEVAGEQKDYDGYDDHS